MRFDGQSHTQLERQENAVAPDAEARRPSDPDHLAGTKRVHQVSKGGSPLGHDVDQTAVNTGIPRTVMTPNGPPTLDRTQEVAGSSPASSMRVLMNTGLHLAVGLPPTDRFRIDLSDGNRSEVRTRPLLRFAPSAKEKC